MRSKEKNTDKADKKAGIKYKRKIDNNSILRILSIIIGVAVNVLFAFIANKLEIPFYLDSAGTIFVSALAGSLPGICCAVATNVFCSFFNRYSMYYMIIGILLAALTAEYARRGALKSKLSILILSLKMALVAGILGTAFQWLLIGGPQFEDVADTAKLIAGGADKGTAYFLLSMAVNIGLNIIDKGVSCFVALFVVNFIPAKKRKAVWNSYWKQTPLSEEEKKAINNSSTRGRISLRLRMGILLTGASTALVIGMGWLGISLHTKNIKNEYTENAHNAARLASEVIDADSIEEFVEKGEEAPGYKETLKMLQNIFDNTNGVKYLYVVEPKPDAFYAVFDTDTPQDADAETYYPGEMVEYEEALEPYMDQIKAGEEIEPLESNDEWGWLMTVYYPVKNDAGVTKAYVAVDVSLEFISGFVREYMLKTILIFSGFYLLIAGTGFWVATNYLIYPVGSMAYAAEDMMNGTDDQEELDRCVNNIKALNIHTGDEVEKLYKAVSGLASGAAEQVREIRYYADATAKMQNGLIITMADMVENRDSDTGAHIQKTAAYVRIILHGLKAKGYYPEKLTEKYMSDVEMSAPLHDVGKINISDAILNKPGKLTEEEYEIMKTHTTAGKIIMERAISTVEGENYLKEARNMAAYHHERWDGKGYPEKLHGEVIPLSARVMAVADVFDALTSPRVYKPAFPLEKALAIIEEGAGTQFDPKVVEVFMENLDEVKKVLKKYQEI